MVFMSHDPVISSTYQIIIITTTIIHNNVFNLSAFSSFNKYILQILWQYAFSNCRVSQDSALWWPEDSSGAAAPRGALPHGQLMSGRAAVHFGICQATKAPPGAAPELVPAVCSRLCGVVLFFGGFSHLPV